MNCPSCNKEMKLANPGREALEKILRKHTPWSGNRRIRKKQMKRFFGQPKIMAARFTLPVSGPGRWRCPACGKEESFYSGIGRSLIQIQPVARCRGTPC